MVRNGQAVNGLDTDAVRLNPSLARVGRVPPVVAPSRYSRPCILDRDSPPVRLAVISEQLPDIAPRPPDQRTTYSLTVPGHRPISQSLTPASPDLFADL